MGRYQHCSISLCCYMLHVCFVLIYCSCNLLPFSQPLIHFITYKHIPQTNIWHHHTALASTVVLYCLILMHINKYPRQTFGIITQHCSILLPHFNAYKQIPQANIWHHHTALASTVVFYCLILMHINKYLRQTFGIITQHCSILLPHFNAYKQIPQANIWHHHTALYYFIASF